MLETRINGILTSGIIAETEAYCAPEDKASHAYNGKRTARTAVFYGNGGHAYVYLCYGIHYLFNVVVGPVDIPHAVLIRAIVPTHGIQSMMERRKTGKTRLLTNGPGKLSRALGINKEHNGLDLCHGLSPIRLVQKDKTKTFKYIATPRIGIDYAEEYVNNPWRFLLQPEH